MKAYLECYPCFFSQVVKTSRMVTSDEEKIYRILCEVSLTLPEIPFDVPPPEISREVYRIISRLTGVDDPYQEIKEKCIRQALSLYPGLKKLVESSEDNLMAAVRLSIAGNVIDFGAGSDFNLERDIKKIMNQDFSINHYQEFRDEVHRSQKILYLADNAGETVFDRLLIEELGKPVVYAVRERPIINDATNEDAICSGIGEVAEIISSGCDAPGTSLKLCSDQFLKVYQKADLIISKGQGNYECLSEEDRPVFFLLKVKCPVTACDIGVEMGSVILMRAKKSRK